LLSNIGVTVLADQYAVGQAGTAYTDDGSLVDQQTQTNIVSLGAELAKSLANRK